MTSRTILVTGGAGFIGSHLVDSLLARGYLVRVLDNLSTGKRANLPDDPGVELIVGDVANAAVVETAVHGCMAVAHLAAVASVQASVDDPIGTHRTNLVGTIHVCEAMRKAAVKRIVFASSAAVYGNTVDGKAVEESAPAMPLTPYAADKLASEHYLDFYRRKHDLEPAVFRFFNIYGPRQDPSSPYSGVISIFTQRAQAGHPITVFGDGEQTRDFVYVGDLVGVLVQAIEMHVVPSYPVNVGWNRAASLHQLLEAIGELCGGLPPIRYEAARAGDIRHSRANNARLVQTYQLPASPMDIRAGLARLVCC